MSEKRKFTFRHFCLLVAAIAAVIIVAVPGGSLIEGLRARRDIRQWEKQTERLNSEIETMEQRIEMLRSDPDTIEKFARENFQFAEHGDDVYIIEEK